MPKNRSKKGSRPTGGDRKARGRKRGAFRGSGKKPGKNANKSGAAKKSQGMQETELQYLQDAQFTPVSTQRRRRAPEDLPQEDAVTSSELSRMIEETADPVATETGPGEEEVAPSTDTNFLTTEELQSLSDVFGHFTEFSEVQYDDPTNLGVPSSGWVSVQTELATLCSSIEEIKTRSETEVEALRPLLAEIKSEVEMGHRGREALASSLITLSEDLQSMRLKLSATSKSAVKSAASLGHLSNRLSRGVEDAPADDQPGYPRPIFLAGFALLVLCWAAILYIRTGDLRMTLFAVVGANFAGCAALLASRRMNWF